MKTKILITSLSLLATSAYAQPSIPSVGMPPPTVRAEMPQPAMQRPTPQPAVGATSGNSARPAPPSTISSGPLPANAAKAPTSVGAIGVATPLPPTMPRGVGPSPLKNDDVGVQKEYTRYEEYEKGDFDVTKMSNAHGDGAIKSEAQTVAEYNKAKALENAQYDAQQKATKEAAKAEVAAAKGAAEASVGR